MIVLASANALAQDFYSTSQLIRELEQSTKDALLKTKMDSIASKEGFDLKVIDSTFAESKIFVQDVKLASHNNLCDSMVFLNKVNTYAESYKSAIYNSNKTRLSVSTTGFITAIKNLRDYVNNTQPAIARLLEQIKEKSSEEEGKKDEDSSDTLKTRFVLYNAGAKDTIATFFDDKEDLLKGVIKSNYIIINEVEYYAAMATCIVFWFIIIVLIVYSLLRLARSHYEKESVPTTEDTLKNIEEELKQLQGTYNEEFGKVEANIKKLQDSIKEISPKIPLLERSIQDLKENKVQSEKKNESHERLLRNTVDAIPPRPRLVKLYGNLSQDGSMVYKASNEPREDLIYQINLKNVADSEGELVIREDLSSEKMKQVINDRATYLMSSACQIMSDSENAYRIETVSKGFVQKVGYDWKIVNPVQVKLV